MAELLQAPGAPDFLVRDRFGVDVSMTQIRIAPAGAAPAMHALVIGVGYYRHLVDGPEPRGKGVHLGLSNLQSPPISAEKFARWLLGTDGSAGGGQRNPNAPLETLEVLISNRNPICLDLNGKSHEVERATHRAVREGFDRWLAKVQSNDSNVGVLYFCGHGVMGRGPEHYLLLDDHGSSQNRPFEEGSFDITTTVRALKRAVRAQLYVFVDACWTTSRKVTETMGSLPHPLLAEGTTTQNINRGMTQVDATVEGMSAYGDSNSVSRFTDALLRALNGFSGEFEPRTKKWLVNGEALNQALPKLLDLVNTERKREPQDCWLHRSGSGDTPLHVRDEPPIVHVAIEIQPEKFQALGTFVMENRYHRELPHLGGALGVWKIDAPRGFYGIRVLSVGKSFPDHDGGEYHVDPPTFRLPVELQPFSTEQQR
jgi:hypothetical protein